MARPEASEATGACLVRQRLTRWEHFSVRQYVFSSCLPRSNSSPKLAHMCAHPIPSVMRENNPDQRTRADIDWNAGSIHPVRDCVCHSNAPQLRGPPGARVPPSDFGPATTTGLKSVAMLRERFSEKDFFARTALSRCCVFIKRCDALMLRRV